MTYYRVKPEYDQTRKNPRTSDFSILIANELYTEREMKLIPLVAQRPHIIEKVFERVEISKFRTYWFFGARFAMEGTT